MGILANMEQREELDLGLDELGNRGALRKSVDAMLTRLHQEQRLDVVHAPLVTLLYKLADALEMAGGRGASVALLSAQYQDVWTKLSELPLPEPDDDDDEAFDVVLIEPVEPPPAVSA